MRSSDIIVGEPYAVYPGGRGWGSTGPWRAECITSAQGGKAGFRMLDDRDGKGHSWDPSWKAGDVRTIATRDVDHAWDEDDDLRLSRRRSDEIDRDRLRARLDALGVPRHTYSLEGQVVRLPLDVAVRLVLDPDA